GRQIRVQVTDPSGVAATGVASNAVRDAAGNQPVYELADGTTIGSGLFQYVYGRATHTTVNNGGQQDIHAGGTATGNALNEGSIQIDRGTAIATVIDGGSQYVYGTAITTTINSGKQVVESGGSAKDIAIYAGGEQRVHEGGMATGTTVLGGSQFVYGA